MQADETANMAQDRREVLLDQLTDHVLTHGLADTGLRTLAAGIGTSDRMLIYYFTDKASLMTALMQHVAMRLTGALGSIADAGPRPAAQLARELPALATSAAFWPYMRFWLAIAAQAAGGAPVCRTVGESIGREFLGWIARQLSGDPAKHPQQAALLLQLIEGAILLNAIGLGDVVEQASVPRTP